MAEYNPSKIIKDGNTYNFRDDTKIPLAGSNQISGDLVPATDNTVSLGSINNHIKNIYCTEVRGSDSNCCTVCGGSAWMKGAGISLRGKDYSGESGEFVLVAVNDTNGSNLRGKPNGILMWNGKIIDCVEEQGDGYIRYTNGIQICWGSVTNNNNIDTGASIYTLPKAFNNSSYSLILTAQSNAVYYVSVMERHPSGTVYKTTTQFGVFFCDRAMNLIDGPLTCSYIALGTWK